MQGLIQSEQKRTAALPRPSCSPQSHRGQAAYKEPGAPHHKGLITAELYSLTQDTHQTQGHARPAPLAPRCAAPGSGQSGGRVRGPAPEAGVALGRGPPLPPAPAALGLSDVRPVPGSRAQLCPLPARPGQEGRQDEQFVNLVIVSTAAMRKPQPFTIGTRLSIPKCPDFSTSSPGVDGASKSRNISERVSHYLAQAAPPSPPQGAARCRSPITCLTDGDYVTPGSLVRSIKKITLSSQAAGAARGEGTAAMSPRLLAKTSHGNCNNNNSRGLRHIVPDAADWSVRDPRMIIAAAESHEMAKCPRPPCDSAISDGVRTAPSAGRASCEPPDIPRLSWEIKQAESWVQCKLQDVTDGGDTFSSTLIQRDIRAFQSTVLTLSQMVDQVSRTQPPGAAAIRSQLHSLRDQWQLLKQTSASQNCAGGGTTSLLEFNKMADELEMWMREKEEIPPLHVLLDENLDKVQITRKILDLKQEQVHYCNLQENINSLAQKLEKQGCPESRAASTRRKHLNRMWLRLQTPLHEHHQSLQLALELASLWHQADAILRTIQEKSRCAVGVSRDDGRGDQDLRDIAGQIMVLDVTVSQVSNLHPLLSSRASHKHRQVKERWARLQQTLRTEKSSRSAASTREPGDSLTSGRPEQSSVGNQEQSLLGSGGLGSQMEMTNEGPFPLLRSHTQRQIRGQISSQCPTEPKRSLTSDPETNHSPHNGHQPPGPPETPEVRDLLRELSSMSQWLQGAELLLSEPAAMRSPELIRKDLKQVSLLEREVRSRGAALQGLRGKARRCHKLEGTVTEEMKGTIKEVEERFQTLQDSLRRRVSDLRDTLVLSEFMKVVEMEEERKKKETMTAPAAVRGDTNVRAADRTQTFTPLEELQEAVEMLNDAVKERERTLAATREAAELESRISALSQMMASARAKLQDVRSWLEAAEKEFVAVKRETELRDLQGMVSQQRQVETDLSGTIGPEMRRLQESWNLSASRSIEDTLRTWTDLQTFFQDNQARLQRTQRLREFYLCYLGMISWTEVTRDQILSESPRGRLTPAQREELERTMDRKMTEFEALAEIGWKLIAEDPHLTQMVKERLEELQGLLGWLLMRWRCQKQQRIMGNQVQKMKRDEAADNMDPPKITSSSLEEFECPEDEDVAPNPAPRGPILRRYRRRALSPILFQPPSCRLLAGTDMVERVQTPEDGPRKCAKGPLWLEPKNLPAESVIPEPQEETIMLPPPHRSFWRRCQGILEGTFGSLKRKKRVSLPVVDEVSSYLNTMEEAQNTYEIRSAPRASITAASSGHDSLFPESSSGSLPKIRSNVFFKSLRRKEKAQRCTIQGIMGLYRKPDTEDPPRYRTSTWPPKQEKNFPSSGTNMELETFLNYVKNPLSKDIDAQCGSVSKKRPNPGPHTIPSSCPHLTVGSALTLHISKEPHILDSIQDAVPVISADDSGNSQHVCSIEKPKPTADKMGAAEEHSSITGGGQWLGAKTWLEALTSSSGYCRQNIHGYGRSTAGSQETQELGDLIENFEIDGQSPNVLQHFDPEWDTEEEAPNSTESFEAISANVSDAHCQSDGAITLSPVLQETGRTTTSSPVLQETGTTSSTVLQETGTTSSTVLQETGTTSSTVLQETGTTSSTVLQETGRTTTSSPVLQETGRTTTSSPVLRETGTTSSTVLRETGRTTTSSPVLRETGRTYCVEKHSHNGQPASVCSSDCVLHTYEPSHHLFGPYNPIEPPPHKSIFTKSSSLREVLHPDHDFLENDDEELECIWNNAKKAPLVSHSMAPKEMVGGSVPPVQHDSHREPCGQIVMGAEPNMLVATITLPLSAETVMKKTPNTWKEKSHSTVPAPASYSPGEVTEERSQPHSPPPETVEKTSAIKLTHKLDFHLMEGPLEKKHVLQVGGRKASSRTWGTFYAVLVRRTLCFYHDHRHSTKSCGSAPPLHLTGAVCTPESDYTKRDNCFRLRLLDGSEYLFRAPTPESLQQWVTKLHNNSGMKDSDLLKEAAMTFDLSPRIRSRSLMPDLCQSVPARVTDMVPVADPPYWKETEKVSAVVTEIPKLNAHHPRRFPASDNNAADPENNLTRRRRSQSFSSVVYQKVTSGPQETSSSYSVTLYIDDPLIPRGRCHSFAALQGELLSRHTADLKPWNKSVFRKFFRKKE